MKNRLKVARAEKDLTQEDLAKLIGVSRQSINAIESGRYVPSTVLALKMAQVFWSCNMYVNCGGMRCYFWVTCSCRRCIHNNKHAIDFVESSISPQGNLNSVFTLQYRIS